MKYLWPLLALLLILPCFVLAGSKSNYAVNLISEPLLSGANSIVRNDEIVLDVENAGKALYQVHRVVTVLNQAGAHNLDIFIYYNKFRHLKSFEATLYDKDGKLMNKRKESDLQDYAMFDGFSLFNDARLKKLQTGGGIYPVTIDYSYAIEMNGILDYPNWYPQEPGQAIEKSVYEIRMPSDIGLKYHSSNINPEPAAEIQQLAHQVVYTWLLQDIKAAKLPVNSYQATYFLPNIDFSPGVFEYSGGYKGSWKSWNAFGSAMYEMWKKTQIVPDDIANEVKEIVKKAHTQREKAELIYAFLQREFRYVSVQIGIGGIVPFEIATVDKARYGDCKALSNYMCALLNTVGIKAYPALINAGADAHPIDTAFPSNYFNHAILYADLNDGPLWLECTSNAMPFGELGTFTENRYALIFDKDGGRIIKTPTSNASLNTLKESSVIEVSDNLQAKVSETTALNGQFRLYAKPTLVLGTQQERSRYVFNNLKLLQPENYTLNNITDSLAQISFDVKGNINKIYDFKTGNKSFLPSTMIKSWYDNIRADSTQKVDLLLDFPSAKSEKLLYKLPESRKVSLPGDYVLENNLVQFSRKCEKQTDNGIMIQTELTIKKNIIPPAEIQLLKESLQTVNKYLQQKLIVEMN